ncbi:MAG TPA: class I SAM-dependent methyltransferase [Patescibacteria group bacterium]
MKSSEILRRLKSRTKNPSGLEYLSIHEARYAYLIEAVNSLDLPADSSILDIGCYPPHLFSVLKEEFSQTFGICSNHEPVDGPGITPLNIETDIFPYADNTFDLVLFTEVLEHLITDPTHLFNEINRILRPGGHLILTTPNVYRLQNIILLLLKKNIYFPVAQLKDSDSLSGSIYYRHNREYTPVEITSYLTKSGLKIENYHNFVSYKPTRSRNSHDSLPLKFVKFANYFLMILFPSRRDTLFFLASKN